MQTTGAKMSLKPKKRSLTLRGHRTSVSIEDRFWRAFCDIADARGMPINELAAEIDETRDPMDAGLASAIRDYVLAHFMILNKDHSTLI
jgi:predicted DNA-binding ribbon-helix-helix protein